MEHGFGHSQTKLVLPNEREVEGNEEAFYLAYIALIENEEHYDHRENLSSTTISRIFILSSDDKEVLENL